MMMKMVSLLTKKYELPTLVSLNPIMVDGTGMCGCCRVTVGKECKFTCVDGPVFDGHSVDYDELLARQRNYLEEEKRAVESWQMKKPRKEFTMSNNRLNGRPKMPQRTVQERIRDFNEVPLGLEKWAAIEEAKRCLQCKNQVV